MKITLYILIFFYCVIQIFSSNLFAQPTQQWVARYNSPGNQNDYPASIAVDSTGNVFVLGITPAYMVLIKYNSSGLQQWVRTYFVGINAHAFKVGVDKQNNAVITGYGFDWRTLKYDPAGNLLWEKIYQYGYVVGMEIDDSSNVYVCGSGSSGTTSDYTVIKYSPLGNQVWIAYYDSGRYDYPHAMAMDRHKNIYVTGESTNAQNNEELVTAHFDSNGVLKWNSRYVDPTCSCGGMFIACDNNNNSYVSSVYARTPYLDGILTIKYTSLGDTAWTRKLNPGDSSSDARPKGIKTDNSGNVILTGISDSSNGSSSYSTIKYSPTGVLLWLRKFTGTGADVPSDMVIDDLNNIYITGSAYNVNESIGTIEYDYKGNLLWAKYFNGFTDSSTSYGTAIALDNNKNVYVTGWLDNRDSARADIVSIKYDQIIGILPINNQTPIDFKLLQNYPNPFNPSTVIKFDLPKKSKVSLILFNLIGQKIKELINSELNAGTYSLNIDLTGFSSGIYFYKLETPEFTETKKLILLK